MYLPSQMTSPKQGFLLQDAASNLAFVAGRKTSSHTKGILLHNFSITCTDLIANKQLFPGWIHKKTVLDQVALHDAAIITACRIQFCGSSTKHDISDSSIALAIQHFFTNPNHTRHVSATNLQDLHSPRHLRSHSTFIASDRVIWEWAYLE